MIDYMKPEQYTSRISNVINIFKEFDILYVLYEDNRWYVMNEWGVCRTTPGRNLILKPIENREINTESNRFIMIKEEDVDIFTNKVNIKINEGYRLINCFGYGSHKAAKHD